MVDKDTGSVDQHSSEQNSSVAAKLMKKERLIKFISILFASPAYDINGNLVILLPAELAGEAMEMVSSKSPTSEQGRGIGDNIEIMDDDISKERNYINRASRFPYLSHTLITYMLHDNYHSGYGYQDGFIKYFFHYSYPSPNSD